MGANSLRPILENTKSLVGILVPVLTVGAGTVAWAVDVRNMAARNTESITKVEKQVEDLGEIKVKLDVLLDFEARQARREGGSRRLDMERAARHAKRRAVREGIDAGVLEGL